MTNNKYCDVCGDKRFEIIGKARQDLITSTNIETSEKEMEVLDSFLYRAWQMGWLKMYEDVAECEFDDEADDVMSKNERETNMGMNRYKVNDTNVGKQMDEMKGLFFEKNKKYAGSFETSLNKYGLLASLVRVSDKFNRFENLVLSGDMGTQDETLIDTLVDMATYCVMTAVYIKETCARYECDEDEQG